MRNYPNIEKSAFYRHEYVGYANGAVFRIRKHRYGGWEAIWHNGRKVKKSASYMRAATLALIAQDIDEFSDNASRKAKWAAILQRRSCAR